MRLAGTAIQYSTSAMAQLAITAIHIGAAGNFRCPYQAVVMKRLEPTNRRIGSTTGDRSGMGNSGLVRAGITTKLCHEMRRLAMPVRVIVTAVVLLLSA